MAWLVLTSQWARFSRDTRSDSSAEMISCGCFTFLRWRLVGEGRNEKNYYSTWILNTISIHAVTVDDVSMFVLRDGGDYFTPRRRLNFIRTGIVEYDACVCVCVRNVDGRACLRVSLKTPLAVRRVRTSAAKSLRKHDYK